LTILFRREDVPLAVVVPEEENADRTITPNQLDMNIAISRFAPAGELRDADRRYR
jgi:hypothetical protein